jgi:hypothetical protein
MEKTMSTQQIPTDAIQALAKFWDQHDLTDFEDQLEEVQEPVFEHKPTINKPEPENHYQKILCTFVSRQQL